MIPADVARLLATIGGLHEHEKQVLCMRFGLDGKRPSAYSEIGKKMKASVDHIRLVEQQALRVVSKRYAEEGR